MGISPYVQREQSVTQLMLRRNIGFSQWQLGRNPMSDLRVPQARRA
jgi:hypothetical protein